MGATIFGTTAQHIIAAVAAWPLLTRVLTRSPFFFWPSQEKNAKCRTIFLSAAAATFGENVDRNRLIFRVAETGGPIFFSPLR